MLFLYTAVQGDTLEKIAEKFCTETENISDLNMIGETGIVGQRLLIQADISVPQWMKNGTFCFDELDCRQLSRLMYRCTNHAKNSVDTNAEDCRMIKEEKNDDGNLNDAAVAERTEQTKKDDQVSAQSTVREAFAQTHTVTEGENLTSIAIKYGVTVRMLNKCGAPVDIVPGDVIGIPSVSGRRFFYTVRIGDSIEKIASRFGCSKEKLLNVNFVDENEELVPGEQLLILI